MSFNALFNQKWIRSVFQATVVMTLLSLSLSGCGGGGGSGDDTTADSDATLSSLNLTSASLDQLFQPSQTTYTASVNFQTTSINLTPIAADAGATIRINDTIIPSGTTSQAIALTEGQNLISLVVTAEDGVSTQRYTIEILRDSAAWFAQQAYLKASNADTNDQFGTSIAISGDTLVVGAPNIVRSEGSVAVDNHGAVYIFTRSGEAWSQQAVLKTKNAKKGGDEKFSAAMFTYIGDKFGYSVAISNDTLVVGAPREESSAYESGAAYVFNRNGGIWSQQAYLKASNPQMFADFGTSVAISGDTVVVGAPGEASSLSGGGNDYLASDSGAAYVFNRNNGTWSQQAYLKASNVDKDDRFGASVAISGDTLVVGAPYENSSVSGDGTDNLEYNAGAAYVFNRSSGVWSQQAFLKASNAEVGDEFGSSVAISGDTLAVSAPYENSNVRKGEDDNSITDSGAAYVFTRSNGTWTQQAFLKANFAGMYDEFGTSLAISGDTLVVGAIGEDSSTSDSEIDNYAFNAGAAYVFTRSDGIWNQQYYLKASNAEANDAFGTGVAISGDTVAAGAPFEMSSASGGEADNSTPSAGAAYVWQ